MKLIRAIVTAITETITETESKIKLFSGSGRVGESFTDREYFQHYGFTSRPLAGAEAILIKDGNVIQVIASDDRSCRLGIEDGEVAIYTNEGDRVHLKKNGVIEVVGGEKVIVNTKYAEVTATDGAKIIGDLTVDGDLSVTGTGTVAGDLSSTDGDVSDSSGTMQGMRDTYNGHSGHFDTENVVPADQML